MIMITNKRLPQDRTSVYDRHLNKR